jgi:hypothetical protein
MRQRHAGGQPSVSSSGGYLRFSPPPFSSPTVSSSQDGSGQEMKRRVCPILKRLQHATGRRERGRLRRLSPAHGESISEPARALRPAASGRPGRRTAAGDGPGPWFIPTSRVGGPPALVCCACESMPPSRRPRVFSTGRFAAQPQARSWRWRGDRKREPPTTFRSQGLSAWVISGPHWAGSREQGERDRSPSMVQRRRKMRRSLRPHGTCS